MAARHWTIAAALTAALSSGAYIAQNNDSSQFYGFGGLGRDFGKLGASNKHSSGGGGGGGCTNKLDYTASCNLRFLFIQPL